MKRKIIITFDDADQSAETALVRTMQIVAGGYRSMSAGVPHYCWATTWEFPGFHIVAVAKIKKNSSSADSLEFVKEDKKRKTP